jgi:hypothetical protein
MTSPTPAENDKRRGYRKPWAVHNNDPNVVCKYDINQIFKM